MGFGDEVLLLRRDLAHMVVEGLRQGREELHVWVRRLASLEPRVCASDSGLVMGRVGEFGARRWADLEICGCMCVCMNFKIYTYLCLSGFALMAGDTYFIEETVQLANDGVDLL